MDKKIPSEHWEQEQFFRWVYANQIRYPELKLCNGSMNGVRVSPRLRAGLKLQGLRPGVPDIDLPVKRFPYSGLRIEMKRRKGGTVSPEQKQFHTLLEQQGYMVAVCKGWIEAAQLVFNYLENSTQHDVA